MKKAFTIIELMICLAVVSILAGAAVPQVKLWNARNRGLDAVTSIIADYSKARSVASYINVEPSASDGSQITYSEDFSGLASQVHIGKRPQIALKFENDGKSYSILQKNRSSDAWTSASVVKLKTTELPSGVNIKKIFFNAISQNDLFVFTPDGRVKFGDQFTTKGFTVNVNSLACGPEGGTIRQATEMIIQTETKVEDGKYISHRIDFNTLGAYHVCVAYHSTSGSAEFRTNGQLLQF